MRKKREQKAVKGIFRKNKEKSLVLKHAGKSTSTNNYLTEQEVLEKLGGSTDVDAVDKDRVEILDKNILKSKIESTVDFGAKRKRKKSVITNVVLLIINIFLVVIIASALIKNADDASLGTLFSTQGKRMYYLLYGVLLFLIYMLLDAIIFSILLKKTTGKFKPWLSYKTAVYGRYYESITPLAVGTQPAQILTLAKGGVSPGIATSIPIIKMTIGTSMVFLVAVLSFIFIGPTLTFQNGFWDILASLLKIIAYIGAFINALYLLLIIIVGNSKVVGRSIARTYIRIGYKLKIVKNYRKSYDKFMRQVFEYQDSMKYLRKNFGVLISSCVLTVLSILVYGSVTFVVSIALSSVEFATTGQAVLFWLQCILKYNICFMAASFIPLPGGTGMNEIAFVIIFAPVIGANFIVWGFLAWRLLTYYSTILQGIIFTIAGTIKVAIQKDKKKALPVTTT